MLRMVPITKETVKRLTPTKDVLRELYLKSGNQCAFPGCSHLMIDADGNFIGEICHIEAAKEGGQRFNPIHSNNDRRAFSNLMLMCHACHKKTDNVQIYTVNVLREMKKNHEKKFSDIVSKLENSISDLTTFQDYSYTSSCKRISDCLNWEYDASQLKKLSDEINHWVDELRKLPLNTRKIFSIMINRSGPNSWDRPRVIIHELQKVTGLGSKAIKEHYDLLLNTTSLVKQRTMKKLTHRL
ncbi:hypothetical protein [Paenibacillus sp. LK1]|uniref:hypothetical protein n=1 Tax=Paenibacillus sp. LK1 TaxID=2053014 RepID=UPI000C17A878|nr:hypothetical protein [Paenibacillus sp. LK1]PIH61099.1 hypothetical protein CS562_01360 [Paenibacillus sp. LK1]